VGRGPSAGGDARADGPGHSYLVSTPPDRQEHTIAWPRPPPDVASRDRRQACLRQGGRHHRRVILDRQLQETIYSSSTQTGSSLGSTGRAQLAAALGGRKSQSRIVITTLQKFPSSSTRSPTSVSTASPSSWMRPTPRRRERPPRTSRPPSARRQPRRSSRLPKVLRRRTSLRTRRTPWRRTVAARGRQPNLSFFAFTATPRPARSSCSGRRTSREGYAPSTSTRCARPSRRLHPRRPRQLHDLRTYWKVGKAVADDPEYDIRKARRSIARFVSLHPHKPRPEGRDHRGTLPRAHPPQDRRSRQGDGGHLVPPALRFAASRPSTPTSTRRATPTRGPSWRSRAASTTPGSSSPSRG